MEREIEKTPEGARPCLQDRIWRSKPGPVLGLGLGLGFGSGFRRPRPVPPGKIFATSGGEGELGNVPQKEAMKKDAKYVGQRMETGSDEGKDGERGSDQNDRNALSYPAGGNRVAPKPTSEILECSKTRTVSLN